MVTSEYHVLVALASPYHVIGAEVGYLAPRHFIRHSMLEALKPEIIEEIFHDNAKVTETN